MDTKRPWEIANAAEADKSESLWHFPHAYTVAKFSLLEKDSLVGETLVNFSCQIEVKNNYISAFLSEGTAHYQEQRTVI